MRRENPRITPAGVDQCMDNMFADWFEKYAQNNDMPNHILVDISLGPYNSAKTYPGYYVNGFKFHTKSYGASKGTSNDGVWCKGDNYSATAGDYYGRLTDILILEYPGVPIKKVVLFMCDWFDPVVGTKLHPDYKLVEVNPTKLLRRYEPLIMAAQATQVYFVPYPSLGRRRDNWVAVCHTKARPIVQVSALNDNSTTNYEEASTSQTTSARRDAFQDDNRNLHSVMFSNADESETYVPLNDPNGFFIELNINEPKAEDSPVVDTSSEEEEEEEEYGNSD